MNKFYLGALGCLMAMGVYAHDFEVNGIYYRITSSSENPTVSVTYKGDSYISYSDEYYGVVTIPSTVTYNNDTYNVTSIGFCAFADCSDLTSVTIPEGVTRIVDQAFWDCPNLASINVPSSVTSIGYMAFSNTAWYGSQPNGIIYAGKVLYEYKGTMPENTIIEVKEGTTGIAGGAFWGCSGLRYITIPNSVTNIGDCAFTECPNLTSIILPESVTSIGEMAFDDCYNLVSITLPENVTDIGCDAFARTAWYDNNYDSEGTVYIGKVLYEYKGEMPENTSIEVKEGTKSITSYAFYECTNLISVILPESVTSIGEAAFSDCCGLASITCCATVPPSCDTWAFNCVESSIPIYVPANSISDYQDAKEWRNFTNFIGVESGIDNAQLTFKELRKNYDLNGCRIEPSMKGIYIIDCKKVMIKN